MLPDLLRAPHERRRIGPLMLLLTLNAAWIDMLSYLSLGRVFASFMTGNFLFIGLGVAQGNGGLLIRALVAVVIDLKVRPKVSVDCLHVELSGQSSREYHKATGTPIRAVQ